MTGDKTEQVLDGGLSWCGRRRRRRRRKERQVTSKSTSSSRHHLHTCQLLLYLLVCLLPLVEGVHLASDQAVGRLGGEEQRLLPDTFQEVEEEEEGSDPYPSWQGFYDPSVVEEQANHPGGHWAGRVPRSSPASPASPATPVEPPKKKKKNKRKGKVRGRLGRGRETGSPKHSSRDCRLEKREMRVRDLGLGFDSDEIVLFKFCVGSCRASRTNYDLALWALLENGSLPRRTVRKVASHPCCRPHKYEPVSFMDAHTTWRTIDSLSAASCKCMG